ncbi:hypothetical protein Niako_6190 [Niastella koreensis GR20-10]|uniref:Gliding motility-associated protein GldM first immunoglobulin-like domain-containing protein n=3 Tax=Niastella koreensis TaxID=354356 RepID=G8TA43_NIAKG|nr:hypothetical protein Niako_6190 [Niastella koreensis GR20-10]
MTMKKALIIPTVIVVLLVGCRPVENREQLKAINRSLEYANRISQLESNLVYTNLREMQKDPGTAYHADIWEPKAEQVKLYADSIKGLLKIIKSDLIKQSDSFKLEYVPVVKGLHDTNEVGGKLLNLLVAFRDNCFTVMFPGEATITRPYVTELNYFLRVIPLLPGYTDSLTANQRSDYKNKWLTESFSKSSSLMAMIMLNKIESDVLVTEKEFIHYCRAKIPTPCGYTKFEAFSALSSSYVKAGQSIEVAAGIGAFTFDRNPRVTIDGKEVELNGDAVAVYKFTVKGKPGKHTIPVTVEFKNFDGSKEVVSRNHEYIIAEN